MAKKYYPPSQETTVMAVDECEEKTASVDATKWVSPNVSVDNHRCFDLRSKSSGGKYSYHGLARGVFHLIIRHKIGGEKKSKGFVFGERKVLNELQIK